MYVPFTYVAITLSYRSGIVSLADSQGYLVSVQLYVAMYLYLSTYLYSYHIVINLYLYLLLYLCNVLDIRGKISMYVSRTRYVDVLQVHYVYVPYLLYPDYLHVFFSSLTRGIRTLLRKIYPLSTYPYTYVPKMLCSEMCQKDAIIVALLRKL